MRDDSPKRCSRHGILVTDRSIGCPVCAAEHLRSSLHSGMAIAIHPDDLSGELERFCEERGVRIIETSYLAERNSVLLIDLDELERLPHPSFRWRR